MPKVSDMTPSRWLKAADLEGDDLTVTIADIKEEQMGQGRDAEAKWVLFFKETDKGLVLNKTNLNTIAKLHGDDTDDWMGRAITLFATEVQFRDEMVEAIRIRSKPPKPVRSTPVPRPDSPRGNGPGGKGAPRTGKGLYAWAKEQEDLHNVGLTAYLASWAKLQEFPARMIDWSPEEVEHAYREAERKMKAIRTDRRPTPAPSPAFEVEADSGDDSSAEETDIPF